MAAFWRGRLERGTTQMMTEIRTQVRHFTAIDVIVEGVAAALGEGVDVPAAVNVDAPVAVPDPFECAN
jgi:hypothetical protein